MECVSLCLRNKRLAKKKEEILHFNTLTCGRPQANRNANATHDLQVEYEFASAYIGKLT